MPELRLELAARGRARTKPGRQPTDKTRHEKRATPKLFDHREEQSLFERAAAFGVGHASSLPDLTTTSCPTPPTPAHPPWLLGRQEEAHGTKQFLQFGPAGLSLTLRWVQSDVAEFFCCARGGDSTPDAYPPTSPHGPLGARALTLVLSRWTKGTDHAKLPDLFLQLCAREEDTWRSLAQASDFSGNPNGAVLRRHCLEHIEARLRALDTLRPGKRPPKISLIYASVLAGLNNFERARHILEGAKDTLERTSPVLALLSFLKFMGTEEMAHEAHDEAAALCYGHLAGAPPVALMGLAMGYELRERKDLATACYVLAATRPISSALDPLLLLGPGLYWLCVLRNRAHRADWMRS